MAAVSVKRSIDKMVKMIARGGRQNWVMAWIDYEKANDMVPHVWIIKCLNLVGAAVNVQTLLGRNMEGWRTLVTSSNESHGEI